ncbi:MAG: protein-export chaperone SecB [Rickettsiella sp.]|nr:protein-export chaperone SecB [Rickettsiella sp.]
MTTDQTGSSQKREFIIQRVYVKDLSLECPQSPQVFQEEWKPELNLDFTMNANSIDISIQEVVLQIMVTAKSAGKILFLVEIKQAGVFKLTDFTDEENQQLLNITCPTILFPYAREAVSDLVGKAGFPPLYLAPVNFEALYIQRLQEKAKKDGNGSTTKKANSENSTITH